MFITIEGLDGSGKSTVIETIEDRYPNVATTAEPSELWTGKQVRRCLSDESIDPLTDFYFFMGDRVHHIENNVRPADERGQLVVSDRYADSTRAYQSVGLGESDHFDDQLMARLFIESTMQPWDYEPDLTFYIDISVDTAIERSSGEEKYENREFLEEVKQNYEQIVDEYDRIVRIDGEQSKGAVAASVVGKIDLPPLDRV